MLRTAVDLADAAGIDALTIRRLAEQLGVEPMSLYYHVANKEAILDGIVELVFDEVERATGGFDVPRRMPRGRSRCARASSPRAA